jgi:hypothetical protein
MSFRQCAVALMAAALFVLGCSKNASDAQTPSAAKASSAATTIPIRANQDVARQLLLPPGTHQVGIKIGKAAFTCTSLQSVSQKGRNAKDEYLDAAAPINMVANTSVTQSSSDPQNPYVLVDIRCHGGAADSELIITPSA